MSKKGGALSSSGSGSPVGYLPTSKTRTYAVPRRTVTRRAPFALLILAALASYTVLYTTIPSTTLLTSSNPSTPSEAPSFGRLDVPSFIPPPDPSDPNPAILIKAKHGAVATEHQTCSQIGVDIMKQGGNAIDAGIASTLCIGVVSMFSAGIGGGGFMAVRVPSTNGSGFEAWTVDFRETAPAAARSDMYVGKPNESRVGGLSVGVPGELMGLFEAHTRWGRLPWHKLVAPARDLAAAFPVGRELGRRLPWFAPLLEVNPDWASIFAPSGKVLKEGEIMRRGNLSRTLGIITEGGIGPFYNGSIARSIVAKTQATGGILTMEDMANYSVIVKPALSGPFMGRKVYVPGAPTSGPVLLHMLRLAERLGIADDARDMSREELGRRIHLTVECMKYGFSARTRVCDPAFSGDDKRIARIPTEEYANAILANVTDDKTHEAGYYQPEYDVKIDHGTSHISTYSNDGTAASITSTVNLLFGSQVLDPETGIILNDEMDDFSTPGQPNAFGLYPSPYNYPAPYKRPLSSTVPTIVESQDGQFELAIGGSGGSRIFGAVFMTLLNLVSARDGDILGAVERGRVHDQLFPARVDVDDTVTEVEMEALWERGHNVSITSRGGVKAVVNAVLRREGTVYAASDSRKNGIAAGW